MRHRPLSVREYATQLPMMTAFSAAQPASHSSCVISHASAPSLSVKHSFFAPWTSHLSE